MNQPQPKGSSELDELKSILGEIPNYIFEYLELSDNIKKEWKYGSKASDFGGHNQFVQKFSKRLEAYAQSLLAAKLSELLEKQTNVLPNKVHGEPFRAVPVEAINELLEGLK